MFIVKKKLGFSKFTNAKQFSASSHHSINVAVVTTYHGCKECD